MTSSCFVAYVILRTKFPIVFCVNAPHDRKSMLPELVFYYFTQCMFVPCTERQITRKVCYSILALPCCITSLLKVTKWMKLII